MSEDKVTGTQSGAHPSFLVRREHAKERQNAGDDGILGIHPTATVSQDQRIKPVAPVVVEKKTAPSVSSWGDRAANLIAAEHS